MANQLYENQKGSQLTALLERLEEIISRCRYLDQIQSRAPDPGLPGLSLSLLPFQIRPRDVSMLFSEDFLEDFSDLTSRSVPTADLTSLSIEASAETSAPTFLALRKTVCVISCANDFASPRVL